MAFEFTQRRIVEFAETDMAGIVHFSNFFRWMESVEHAFFRSLGLTVHGQVDGQALGWARVHADCDYREPLRYQDEIELRLLVREKRTSAITYVHQISRIEPGPRVVVAQGSITTVCVGRGSDGSSMKALPMPSRIANLIEAAPPDSFDVASSDSA
jgi:YbgC/YbaW family acyl-CoA thioester hydrolase